MSHNVEQINGREISALTIRPTKQKGGAHTPTELRITKLGGVGGGTHKGIKLKPRPAVDGGVPGPIEIKGEDLFALREFLAELPEEAFVRPADPIEVPPRWTDDDIVEEHYGAAKAKRRIWVRTEGHWRAIDGRTRLDDALIQDYLTCTPERDDSFHMVILRQKSGQDL